MDVNMLLCVRKVAHKHPIDYIFNNILFSTINAYAPIDRSNQTTLTNDHVLFFILF